MQTNQARAVPRAGFFFLMLLARARPVVGVLRATLPARPFAAPRLGLVAGAVTLAFPLRRCPSGAGRLLSPGQETSAAPAARPIASRFRERLSV